MSGTLIPMLGVIPWIVGRDMTIDFTILDGGGEPFPMTGSCDHAFIVKVNKRDADDQAILHKTGACWTVTDGPNGIITLQIGAEDRSAAAVDGRLYPAEVWFKNSGGKQISGWLGSMLAQIPVRRA